MLSYHLLLTHISYIHKHVDTASLLTNKTKFYTIHLISPFLWGFPGGSVGKESTAMQEMWVQSLGWEDALEK